MTALVSMVVAVCLTRSSIERLDCIPVLLVERTVEEEALGRGEGNGEAPSSCHGDRRRPGSVS